MEALAHKTRFGASALSMWLLSVAAPVGLQSQQASSPARAPDVHFVPTDTAIVRAMLQVAQVDSKDLVYDLGCGDGRIVITAVKRHGARASVSTSIPRGSRRAVTTPIRLAWPAA